MFRSTLTAKTVYVVPYRSNFTLNLHAYVCVSSHTTNPSTSLSFSLVSFPLSCWISVTHNPDTTVDIKATFAPQETQPRHLFVCTSGYAVSLLNHSGSLCFNTGWLFHHRPELSTLIHFLICLITMRNLIESF